MTGLGPVEVTHPRVHDRRPPGERERFTSKILPPYLRKARSVEELIPWLYLKGVSTGDFGEPLAALLGPDCPGLSASTVTRLKQGWEADYQAWSQRDLWGKRYVYIWADGVHFNVRLEEDRTCILVLMGATAEGTQELIAVRDGYRESEPSWKSLLLDVKQRGLSVDPELATGDGALGFWKAVPQVFPATRPQRPRGCWVHKTANVLDKLPKRLQPEAKDRLHQIWMAPTRRDAEAAADHLVQVYQAKSPKATSCLSKDRVELLTFYDFPAELIPGVGTPADDQSDREHLRHRAAPHRQNQGLRLTSGHPDPGLQARPHRPETLATTQRPPTPQRHARRHHLHQRNQTTRRLINDSSTKLDDISCGNHLRGL